VANASLRVVGRLDAAEAERPEYGFLTAAGRGRAGILKPGTMIVLQPEIPTPLLVRFPFRPGPRARARWRRPPPTRSRASGRAEVRFLHTADWHVGKPLRGRSRMDEHAGALEQVAAIAIDRRVDAVLVAGDVFDSPVPPPEAERLVYDFLAGSSRSGSPAS